jgi:hypothetical protein
VAKSSTANSPASQQQLNRLLLVLDDDPEQHPSVPETLLARHPTSGLPQWWPTLHPWKVREWTSPEESRSVLLDRIRQTLDVDSLPKVLSPTHRQSVVSSFHRIASELRSMGFDTPE